MTMQPTDNKLIISGIKLKQARRAVSPKLNQEDLARKIGIVRQTLVQWEKQNAVIMDADQANKIAKVLKVSLQTLQNVPEIIQGAEEPTQGYIRSKLAEDLSLTLKQYDELYKTLVESLKIENDRHIERIRHLEGETVWYRTHINKLTEGFAALDKAKK
jgi:DNA-binding XRE family transcriptional regulator